MEEDDEYLEQQERITNLEVQAAGTGREALMARVSVAAYRHRAAVNNEVLKAFLACHEYQKQAANLK